MDREGIFRSIIYHLFIYHFSLQGKWGDCPTHPIFNVGFPPYTHVPQVKQFDIPIVIASTYTAVLIIKCMTYNGRDNEKERMVYTFK